MNLERTVALSVGRNAKRPGRSRRAAMVRRSPSTSRGPLRDLATLRATVVVFIGSLTVAGCNCGGSHGGGGTLPDGGVDLGAAKSFAIDPADPVLTLDGT